MVFVRIEPIGDQQPLTSEQLRGMASALGVMSGTPISMGKDGSMTLGLPDDRFLDQDTAKASVGMVLRMQYGENWDRRFRVLDG